MDIGCHLIVCWETATFTLGHVHSSKLSYVVISCLSFDVGCCYLSCTQRTKPLIVYHVHVLLLFPFDIDSHCWIWMRNIKWLLSSFGFLSMSPKHKMQLSLHSGLPTKFEYFVLSSCKLQVYVLMTWGEDYITFTDSQLDIAVIFFLISSWSSSYDFYSHSFHVAKSKNQNLNAHTNLFVITVLPNHFRSELMCSDVFHLCTHYSR